MTEQDHELQDLGWFRKLRSYVTIEPVIVFYIFGVVSSTGLKVFEYEKACATKLDVDLAVCEFFPQLEDNNLCDDVATEEMTNSSSAQMLSAIANFTTDSDQHFSKTVCSAKEKSINEVAFLNSYRSIITGLVQAVVLLFAGSWSDRVGLRKPCILIPIAADIANFCVLILCATFMREISLEVTGILPNLLTSLSGGTPLVVTGMYSYLTVCTSEKNRTFRFACAAVVIATIPIGANFFSGFLFKSLGFVKLCLLCIVTDSIGLMYGFFILKEPTEISDNSAVQEKESRSNQNGGTLNESWRKLFDFTLVIDCIQVLTRKRNFNLRLIVILTVVVYFINYGSLGDAESAAILAYLRFNWITNLGTWISYDLATTLLGTLLAMGVLSKRFGVSDFLICVFSVCFTLVGKPIMAYAVSAVKPHLYYVATSIDVFEGSKTVAIRSIVSKLVEQHEIGKMLAIIGIVDSMQVVIYPTLYSTVYLKTQDFFLGSVFLLSEAFLLVSLGFYITLYFLVKKSNRRKTAEITKQNAMEGIDNPAMEITSL
ncbi:thymic stromal cotransporter homolog [Culex pipiens pallens]|uniref:thymic stromal cotransporter homolog n=1 Tax=Culex pipiens pallens TaxID=42434 RepID=UPI001954E3BA|nr:thymic stromal cotransporter homolog [Culex pipiens pallens]